MSDGVQTSIEWQALGGYPMDGVGVLDGDEYASANRPFADVYDGVPAGTVTSQLRKNENRWRCG